MNDLQRAEYAGLIEQNRELVAALQRNRQRMSELAPMNGPDYRIALCPDDRGADPLGHGTLMDDIVVRNVPMFRAEQMSDANWWVACYLDDDTHDRICWSVTARSRPLRLEWVTTEFPDGPTVYEHDLKVPSPSAACPSVDTTEGGAS